VTQALDFLQFPLRGSQLIEASAGTGKTFTLALLYTRLILGHGDEQSAYSRPLTPDEILVVTFTDAAAEELRDRIRARLVDAAEHFGDADALLSDTDPLTQLRNSYPREQWPDCAWRLRSAAQAMDEACISTIHGWCNRVLVEHAFDTRGLFQRELITDIEPVLSEVVRDYWRQTFYPLTNEQAELINRHFGSPAELQAELRDLLALSTHGSSFSGEVLDVPTLTPVLEKTAQQEAELQAAVAKIKSLWRTQRDEIHALLQALRPCLNGTTHDSAKPEKFDALLSEIDAWSESAPGTAMPKKLLNFGIHQFRFLKKREQEVTPLPVFLALQAYQDAFATPDTGPDLRAQILAHASKQVQQLLQRRLQQRAEMGFDDLLRHLAQALDPQHSGNHADHLAAQLRDSFPVAMIDEFQDTDPVQYHIFDSIYRLSENSPDFGLFMIGDPKQAIYSFRGADIHTYLQAREATEGRHHTLPRNFRSTAEVVQACNDLFHFAEQQPRGAFRFRSEQHNPIPFQPVSAAGRQDTLYLCGRTADAMAVHYFPAEEGDIKLTQSAYKQAAAALAASEIARWLQAARTADSGFGTEGQLTRALRPADIAILVRSAKEAQQMRDALSGVGVASVYLSDRESLFHTQEAKDVLHWLVACAEPANERLVKSALATNSCCLPLQQMARWQEDEMQWEQQMHLFIMLHRLWRQQGVLAMLHRLLEQQEIPGRLLQVPDGERRLTNLLHLAEWLQQASGELDGEQALIRHLSEHISSGDEQQLLRLESDAERVQVITIHKSKGLEYPLVLLPFIASWHQSGTRKKQVPYRMAGQLYRELAAPKVFAAAWDNAEDERLSEDMRLLYVALTRASHALWLGVGPLSQGKHSRPQLHQAALGHVLNGGQAMADDSTIWEAFCALAHSSHNITLLPAAAASATPLKPGTTTTLEAARPLPQLGPLGNWWIASYSAISARLSARERLHFDAQQARDEREDELSDEVTALPGPSTGSEATQHVLHCLPAGASWGTFMHGILEWAARHQHQHTKTGMLQGFAAAAADETARNAVLARRCRQRGIEALAPELSEWLQTFLQRPMPLPAPSSAPLCLAELQAQQVSVEMEFLLPSQQVAAKALDRLIASHTLGASARPALEDLQLNGMLKGFIDLVVAHEGRYYVIDWKSNRLGDNASAYGHAALEAVILKKRYDLQYVLYLLALHRQLRARLPGYDYEKHVGGAIYVFLRGHHNTETQGLFHDRPPRDLIETLDRLFRGQSSLATGVVTT